MPIKVGTVCMGDHFLTWDPTPTDPYHFLRTPYSPTTHQIEIDIRTDQELDPPHTKIESWEEPGYCPDTYPQLGNLVLCRTNAPIIQLAYDLIKNQVPCKIQGRDIGANLEALIKKLVPSTATVAELITAITLYRSKELAKIEAANPMGGDRLAAAIQLLDDKTACVDALCFDLDTVDQVLSRIQVLFANINASADTSQYVLLSSVHKAKGLESHTVRIIKPELMPHPMARTPESQEQEKNLIYVAYTRFLDTLHVH